MRDADPALGLVEERARDDGQATAVGDDGLVEAHALRVGRVEDQIFRLAEDLHFGAGLQKDAEDEVVAVGHLGEEPTQLVGARTQPDVVLTLREDRHCGARLGALGCGSRKPRGHEGPFPVQLRDVQYLADILGTLACASDKLIIYEYI